MADDDQLRVVALAAAVVTVVAARNIVRKRNKLWHYFMPHGCHGVGKNLYEGRGLTS